MTVCYFFTDNNTDPIIDGAGAFVDKQTKKWKAAAAGVFAYY